MNTPAHMVFNLALIGRGDPERHVTPVALGSLLPDLPIFLFYIVERLFWGTPERVIWTETYFRPRWQDFFDLFNSIPLIGAGLLLAWHKKSKACAYFFASMLLHVLCDLPLHHDDAHRHFFPFSNWRFASPFSYWDPRHFGAVIAPIEAVAVVVGCAILYRRHHSAPGRLATTSLACVYAAYLVFALLVYS